MFPKRRNAGFGSIQEVYEEGSLISPLRKVVKVQEAGRRVPIQSHIRQSKYQVSDCLPEGLKVWAIPKYVKE